MPQLKVNFRRGTPVAVGLPPSTVASYVLTGMMFLSGSQLAIWGGDNFRVFVASASASGV